jgi:hypothetical protein
MTATPSPHFAIPPYKAVQYSPQWAGVENAQGFNCLSFTDKPGAKFTTMENAEAIAKEWNK